VGGPQPKDTSGRCILGARNPDAAYC
jgi:hypothetical protein